MSTRFHYIWITTFIATWTEVAASRFFPPARVSYQVFPTCTKSDSPEDPGQTKSGNASSNQNGGERPRNFNDLQASLFKKSAPPPPTKHLPDLRTL
ncbi:DNA replication complex GINS protein psf-3 [Apiospora arundinis]